MSSVHRAVSDTVSDTEVAHVERVTVVISEVHVVFVTLLRLHVYIEEVVIQDVSAVGLESHAEHFELISETNERCEETEVLWILVEKSVFVDEVFNFIAIGIHNFIDRRNFLIGIIFANTKVLVEGFEGRIVGNEAEILMSEVRKHIVVLHSVDEPKKSEVNAILIPDQFNEVVVVLGHLKGVRIGVGAAAASRA